MLKKDNMKSRPLYSINEEVPFLETYINWRTRELIHYTLKKGKVIDSTCEDGEWFYTVDPWVSGHYGHKCFKVPERFLHPIEETIEDCRKNAPVKICNGWKDKH
jgi:hypothetical protein